MNLEFAGIFFLMAATVAAQENAPGFDEGAAFGKSDAASVSESLKRFNSNDVPGFVTDNPKEVEYSTNISDNASRVASQSELANTLRQNYQNRPTGIINKQEVWVQKGLAMEETATPTPELTGHTTDCKTTTPMAIPQYQILSCDEFTDGVDKSCTVGQVVEVDAKHTYACKSTRITEKQSCEKILNVKIEDKVEKVPSCTPGSIIATGKGAMIPSVHCDIDSPTITIDFACTYRNYNVTYKIPFNPSVLKGMPQQSGVLDFYGCMPGRGSVWKTIGYSLFCKDEKQCTFFAGLRQINEPFYVHFNRPQWISETKPVVIESWDNQCMALEERVK